MKYIWEAVSEKRIRRPVKEAMWESGRPLIAEYPEDFNEGNIKEYIDDLIHGLVIRLSGTQHTVLGGMFPVNFQGTKG